MIFESPDKLLINGRKLSWIDGTTFFAFKTPAGKIHIAITSGAGTEFLLQINHIDLTDYVKKNLPEAAVYLDHESLANVLHQIKPDMIKPKMARDEFVFSGRLWNGNGVNYISFWNTKKAVDKSLLDKLMGYVKVDYKNTLFEFPNNQGNYNYYDKVEDGSPKQSEYDKFKSQLHTLPPGAKKWAMKGMSMREALFRESPDTVYPPDDEEDEYFRTVLSYDGSRVTSVFSIFKDVVDGKDKMIVALCKNGNLYSITTGDDVLDKEIDVAGMVKSLGSKSVTHGKLLAPLAKRIRPGRDKLSMRNFSLISGRAFYYKGVNYISVWEEMRNLKKQKRHIDKLIDMLNVRRKDVKFETIDFLDEFVPYETFFGNSEKRASSLSPEQIKDLMKKQHLDPRAKKILHTLASSEKYLDSVERAAKDMNVSVAQLKNMMTVGD
jgi:hypothetical protein